MSDRQRLEQQRAAASAPAQTMTQTTDPGRRTETARVLRLRGGNNASGRSVQWAEDVVDNEGLGRRSSKVCCIYHKPKGVDESSDESSSDSSSSSDSDSDSDKDKGGGGGKVPACGHSHHGGGRRSRGKKRADKQKRRPPSPNAYEKVPKPKPKDDVDAVKA
ncbi:hypothetical protein HIM_00254 [Hirsutella minnesotensis 3608]|nr:hypothetical protein HIM_00254 [Hirsutella minnesotensis 3608]